MRGLTPSGAGIASGIAHFTEHPFVERTKGLEFLGRVEMDGPYLVNDLTEEIARAHARIHAGEHSGNHLAALTLSIEVRVGKKPRG